METEDKFFPILVITVIVSFLIFLSVLVVFDQYSKLQCRTNLSEKNYSSSDIIAVCNK
jgi:cell division protein FtsL